MAMMKRQETAADTKAPIVVTMLEPIRYVEANRELAQGQAVELPRATAARWHVMAWAAPPEGVRFTLEELHKAGAWALRQKDLERGGRGSTPAVYWSLPANARWLERLDALTRPEGPQEAA